MLNSLTPLERAKLGKYIASVGRMTVDEALSLAVEAEQFAKDVGVHDMAYAKFSNDSRHFLQYAELLEKEQPPS